MLLDKNETKNIAALARIGVNEEEIEKYRKELSSILDYFKKLDELDTDKTEPIGHITGMKNIYREDQARNFGDLGKKDILCNAPKVKDGYIKVKSVL